MKKLSSIVFIMFVSLLIPTLYSQTPQGTNKDEKATQADTSSAYLRQSSALDSAKIPETAIKQPISSKQLSEQLKKSSINIEDNEGKAIDKTQQALKNNYKKNWNFAKNPEYRKELAKGLKLVDNYKANKELYKQPAGDNTLNLDEEQLEQREKTDQQEHNLINRLNQQ